MRRFLVVCFWVTTLLLTSISPVLAASATPQVVVTYLPTATPLVEVTTNEDINMKIILIIVASLIILLIILIFKRRKEELNAK